MKRTQSKVIEQIVIMRAANWSQIAISEHLEVSLSTVRRSLKKHAVKPGEAQEALIAQAKQDFIDTYGCDEGLRAKLVEEIAENLALGALGRQKMAEALEMLNPTDTRSAATVIKAVAACATATKTFSDSTRHSLPELQVASEMPEFVIRTMTAEDVSQLRTAQNAELAEIYGFDDENGEEEVTLIE